MAKTPWTNMTVDEKLEALRQDIKDIADFVNPLAKDIRELNARMSEVAASLHDLRKKVASTNQP